MTGDEFEDLSIAFNRSAKPHDRLIADMSRNERMSQAEQVTFENLPYLETFMVACIDAALAAQNAVVAAEIAGTAHRLYRRHAQRPGPRCMNCWACRQRPSSCSASASAMPIRPPRTRSNARLPQSTVLHHERYDAAPEARDRPAYDAEMAQFSARNEMQATTWTARMLNRMGPIKAMNGRERIRATLAKLGFEIR